MDGYVNKTDVDPAQHGQASADDQVLIDDDPDQHGKTLTEYLAGTSAVKVPTQHAMDPTKPEAASMSGPADLKNAVMLAKQVARLAQLAARLVECIFEIISRHEAAANNPAQPAALSKPVVNPVDLKNAVMLAKKIAQVAQQGAKQTTWLVEDIAEPTDTAMNPAIVSGCATGPAVLAATFKGDKDLDQPAVFKQAVDPAQPAMYPSQTVPASERDVYPGQPAAASEGVLDPAQPATASVRIMVRPQPAAASVRIIDIAQPAAASVGIIDACQPAAVSDHTVDPAQSIATSERTVTPTQPDASPEHTVDTSEPDAASECAGNTSESNAVSECGVATTDSCSPPEPALNTSQPAIASEHVVNTSQPSTASDCAKDKSEHVMNPTNLTDDMMQGALQVPRLSETAKLTLQPSQLPEVTRLVQPARLSEVARVALHPPWIFEATRLSLQAARLALQPLRLSEAARLALQAPSISDDARLALQSPRSAQAPRLTQAPQLSETDRLALQAPQLPRAARLALRIARLSEAARLALEAPRPAAVSQKSEAPQVSKVAQATQPARRSDESRIAHQAIWLSQAAQLANKAAFPSEAAHLSQAVRIAHQAAWLVEEIANLLPQFNEASVDYSDRLVETSAEDIPGTTLMEVSTQPVVHSTQSAAATETIVNPAEVCVASILYMKAAQIAEKCAKIAAQLVEELAEMQSHHGEAIHEDSDLYDVDPIQLGKISAEDLANITPVAVSAHPKVDTDQPTMDSTVPEDALLLARQATQLAENVVIVLSRLSGDISDQRT